MFLACYCSEEILPVTRILEMKTLLVCNTFGNESGLLTKFGQLSTEASTLDTIEFVAVVIVNGKNSLTHPVKDQPLNCNVHILRAHNSK